MNQNTPGLTTEDAKPASGVGMDRKVTKPPLPWKKVGSVAVAIAIVIAAYALMQQGQAQGLVVEQNKLSVNAVTQGQFEYAIPVRARVTPAKTLFLDAIEGGRIEKIYAEDGALLKSGDLIVELSNTALQLDVTRNEAVVAEQLNNMRSIELSLEQNRLQHKRNLIDIQYQIKMLTRQLSREENLLAQNSIAENKVDDTRDTLDWYKQRLLVTQESQKTDADMQEQQLAFLRSTGEQLEKNLAISRQNLENMRVRAPVDGKLSGFDVEIGQSIQRGGRLGQIDTPDNFKLSASIDEFYLRQVNPGQQAVYVQQGKEYPLQISKIYPQVNNGEFEVDFTFAEGQPEEIRRGQGLQIKLTLGESRSALLLKNGAFYQTSGGSWVYVLSEDGTTAVKRPISIGRRNQQYIEVLSGLSAGEQVITSSYSAFQNIPQLQITKG